MIKWIVWLLWVSLLTVILFRILLPLCKKKMIVQEESKKRGIRIVIDSGDSDSFYKLMEIIKTYKPFILGAQYNDAITDVITVNLIVKEEKFQTIISKVMEIENAETGEAEIREEFK